MRIISLEMGCVLSSGICLIEWASRIEEILPDNAVVITIEKDLEQGTDYRKITAEGQFDGKMEVL